MCVRYAARIETGLFICSGKVRVAVRATRREGAGRLAPFVQRLKVSR